MTTTTTTASNITIKQPITTSGQGNPMSASAKNTMSIASTNNAKINALKGGRKYTRRRIRKHRKGGTITVPTVYTPVNDTGNYNANNLKGITSLTASSQANSVYDKNAGVKTTTTTGGRTTMYNWGCYSGGKRQRSIRKKNKTKKSRNNRKMRLTKKYKQEKNRCVIKWM